MCNNVTLFTVQVIVLWTANTERYSNVMNGLNDTADNLLASIERNETEVAPSSLYAVACIKEGVPFINGAPQNTFVPGLIEYAVKQNVLIAGDDFKSGQTKMKSVLVDFLVGAGIKPKSIVSYNHLGNNDGMNLSAPQTFRSKEISKSNVVDDMVASNSILYKPGEHPDHVVVIKYVPNVGDSKRAMDEYMSEIFMGGHNTISMHNTCEDSLLAAPIILDLVLLAELTSRIQVQHPAWCSSLSDLVTAFCIGRRCAQTAYLCIRLSLFVAVEGMGLCADALYAYTLKPRWSVLYEFLKGSFCECSSRRRAKSCMASTPWQCCCPTWPRPPWSLMAPLLSMP